MKRFLAVLAFAAVALAGCGERTTGTAPAGSDTAAAMPDTTQPRDPNAALTAPDAGVTGAVPPSPEQAAPPPAEQPK
ncbi:hypothetical protein [Phenylobacterium sp.]|uniref:hypothetical protein n=1 Tax=Phenylobacterium sp. TaxID=1871053 RepID=UPI002EDB0C2A